MEYNTIRPKMEIPEYGRHVQKMVENLLNLEKPEEQHEAAKEVIRIMALINPQVKQAENYDQVLWDHLHIISDFKLEIDGPFPKPEKDIFKKRPDKLPYIKRDPKYRYYGKFVEKMIDKAMEMEEGEEKQGYLNSLANYMRMAYRMWNEEKVHDDIILNHIEEMSGGKIKMDKIYFMSKGDSRGPRSNRGPSRGRSGGRSGGGQQNRGGGRGNQRKNRRN